MAGERAAALRDQTAIVGVGLTDFSERSGKTVLELALEAGKNAIDDAGLTNTDIDGVVCYMYSDSAAPGQVASTLGIGEGHLSLHSNSGGDSPPQVTGWAAMAVATGMADTVLVYRALNGRSGMRIGGSGGPTVPAGRPTASGEGQFTSIYGMAGPIANYAMLARPHMAKYGLTNADLAPVAVMMREHAQLNPRAITYGKPMTIEDHQNSRMIVDPYRLFDCCFEVDGGVAFIVTTAERAKDLKHPPVYIRGVGYSSGALDPDGATYAKTTAPRVLAAADVELGDIDVACISDDYTWTFLGQLEDYGWAGGGEGSAWVSEGRGKIEGGDVACNPHGGQLSEAFVHDMNQISEAVFQLRGEAGDRQVAGAEVALATGTAGRSAIILRR